MTAAPPYHFGDVVTWVEDLPYLPDKQGRFMVVTDDEPDPDEYEAVSTVLCLRPGDAAPHWRVGDIAPVLNRDLALIEESK